jgi:hypothetical protein
MLRHVSIAIGGMLIAHLTFALPEFKGMLANDMPHYAGDSIHGKNLHVGIPDIEDVVLGDEEMLIRIYGLGSLTVKGGYPADLKEIHVNGDAVTILWYPLCPGEPETTRSQPDEAWRVLQEMEFFTINDYRNISGYPGIRDGILFVVQIRTATASREFAFSNPQMYESPDNARFNTSLSAIEAEFDTPACYAPGLLNGVPRSR